MSDINICTFTGRLGADPETRYTPNGTAVTNFRIAANWKGKDKEGVEWVPITSFGKLAEICGSLLSKGSRCAVSGKFHTRKWKDREGNDRYTSEVVISEMTALDPRDQTNNSSAEQSPSYQHQAPPELEESEIPF